MARPQEMFVEWQGDHRMGQKQVRDSKSCREGCSVNRLEPVLGWGGSDLVMSQSRPVPRSGGEGTWTQMPQS
jgi:hypothetical protein